VRDLHPFVGRTLECKIIELDKNRNNVVLSRRAYLEETQREQRDEFLANLKPGEIRSGVVSSVVNFGAFVDLGGMDGLVHVSELSWKHIDHPSAVVAVGDEVEVRRIVADATGAEPRELRFLRTSTGLVAFLTLGLDGTSRLDEAHAQASEIEERIRRARPDIADVIVHTEP